MADFDVNMFITNMKMANTIAKQQILICDAIKNVLNAMNGKADTAEVSTDINSLKESVENISSDLENCVTKLAINNVPKAYIAQEDTGRTIGIEVAQGAKNYTITQRDGAGHVKTTSPTYDDDATNKHYVDSKLGSKANNPLGSIPANAFGYVNGRLPTQNYDGCIALVNDKTQRYNDTDIPTCKWTKDTITEIDTTMASLPDDPNNIEEIVGNNVTSSNYYDDGKHLSGKHNYYIQNVGIKFIQYFTLDDDFVGSIEVAVYGQNNVMFYTGNRVIILGFFTNIDDTFEDIFPYSKSFKYDKKHARLTFKRGTTQIYVTKTAVFISQVYFR